MRQNFGNAALTRGSSGVAETRTAQAVSQSGRCNHVKWVIIFAVIALIAGALGFGGIAGAAAGIAKILFFIFLAIVVFFLIAAIFVGKKVL